VSFTVLRYINYTYRRSNLQRSKMVNFTEGQKNFLVISHYFVWFASPIKLIKRSHEDTNFPKFNSIILTDAFPPPFYKQYRIINNEINLWTRPTMHTASTLVNIYTEIRKFKKRFVRVKSFLTFCSGTQYITIKYVRWTSV
jgi:hypothetical protein